MARLWRWFNGFEAGVIRRSADPGDPTLTSRDQDSYDHTTSDGLVGNVRTGNYGDRLRGGLFGSASGVDAHYESWSKDWRFWCGGIDLDTFELGNPGANDDYVLARCTDLEDGGVGGGKYLGLGLRWISGSPHTVKLSLLRFDELGSFDVILALTTTTWTFPTGYLWFVIGQDGTNARLWIDGTEEIGDQATGSIKRVAMMLPDAEKFSGKSADKTLKMHTDDWGACDGDAVGDRPPTTTGVVLYQSTSSVLNTWTGDHTDVDDENDASPSACDLITPGSIGDRQTFGFPDNAGGTIEAIRVVWEESSGINAAHHKLLAKTTGGTLQVYTDAGNGADPAGGVCGGAADARWLGRNFSQTPEAAAWDTTKFNALEVGLEALAADRECGELYVMAIGTSLVAPAQTGGAVAVRRRLAQVI